MFGRENLGKEVAEKEFAHAAAEFGSAQDVDQFGGGFADLVDLADFFAEVADDLGSVVEPLVHGGGGGLEVLGDGLAEDIEALLEGVELLLKHQDGRVGGWRFGFGAGEEEDEEE